MYPFQEHGIDGVQLSQMVEEDLENLGIPKVFDRLVNLLLILWVFCLSFLSVEFYNYN